MRPVQGGSSILDSSKKLRHRNTKSKSLQKKGVSMTTKTYQYGDLTFKTHFKTVGQGYEVSLYCSGKPYFVGNFVHKKEALAWWKTFNREITTFAKKYWCSNQTPHQWYCHFMTNHLYKTYYSFLDKLFTRYNKDYRRAYVKDVKKYNRLKKNWHQSEKFHLTAKRAA